MSYDFNRPELPALGWLANMKKDDRAVFASYGEFLPAQSDRPIISEGEPQSNLYFILNGTFHIWKVQNDQPTHLATLRTGDSVGEMSVFDLSPASATVIPEGFGQIWRINYEEFMRFVEDNPGAANVVLFALLTLLAKRLRSAQNIS